MALGVAAGAMGSHLLSGMLSGRSMEVYELAVHYHLLHGLGLLAVAFVYHSFSHRWVAIGGVLLIVGILLFSGSLYILALTGWRGVAIVTPFGGLAFIVGWLMVGVGSWRAMQRMYSSS